MAADVHATKAIGAVRCRAIVDADIDAVVALLAEGFAARSADYWRRGIARHLSRPVPAGVPRLGHVLECDGALVGVLLALYSTSRQGEATALRCNLSSWYVRPAFRAYAGMLDAVAMRRKDVTYLNISAVRHTWPMHEARGFRRYCSGEFVALPLLSRPHPDVRISDAIADARHGLPEEEVRMLADHAAFGCVTLVATDPEGSEPFVFVRRPAESLRRRLGFSPLSYFHLVYCRSTASLPRYAHALGRHILRHHAMPWIVVDADGAIPGLVGRFVSRWGAKFARGPTLVRNGDLRYTELVLFGE